MNSSLKHTPSLLKINDPHYLLALFWGNILLEPRLALDLLARSSSIWAEQLLFWIFLIIQKSMTQKITFSLSSI